MKNKIINVCPRAAIIILLLNLIQFHCKAQIALLPNGFAHNDYLHKRPLFDALDNGFMNIEADIFLKGNKLVVAHIFPFFKRKRTLEATYFRPLSERVATNNGSVFAGYSKPIILMIDIKTGADNTYRMLIPLLEKYKSMLTGIENGKIVYRSVTIVLSGHKPYNLIENSQDRLAFIDEDLRRVSRDTSYSNVFTLASCKYSKMISWDGNGLFTEQERAKLCSFVAMAHRQGEKVRLWASPERKVVWDELLKCGVDLINTDKLAMLRDYDESRLTAYNTPELADGAHLK
jgi:hypothetical protein